MSPALARRFFTTSATWKAKNVLGSIKYLILDRSTVSNYYFKKSISWFAFFILQYIWKFLRISGGQELSVRQLSLTDQKHEDQRHEENPEYILRSGGIIYALTGINVMWKNLDISVWIEKSEELLGIPLTFMYVQSNT